jgi:Predicted membrane protein
MNPDMHNKGPAALFQHSHPPVKNANTVLDERSTWGQRVADRVTAAMGSWPFIITQTIILAVWVGINIYLAAMAVLHPEYLQAWDPYPFILLNLVLSLQAAYTGPVVMMSQNRQAARDRLSAQLDYEVNLKAEQEIEVIMQHLAHQDELIKTLTIRLEELHEKENSESKLQPKSN